ncbi:hypothetical protein VT50_0210645 [Streptomyces antioxidans]|uniref:Uncharacterized protein n=1 Tax=Streptomyces antioxidans TaxID=1507734 RepID=A0A1V4D886_9ACTN|nr:hypothetical protein VT50_0210645 [Streptomyces antioxidans]
MLTVGVLGLLPAPAFAQSAPAASPERSAQGERANPGVPQRIRLDHPVSVAEALTATQDTGIELADLRFGGNGVVGGYVSVPGESATDQAEKVDKAFRTQFGRAAVAAEVSVPEKTPAATVERLRDLLAGAPTVRVENGPVKLPEKSEAMADKLRTNGENGAGPLANDFDTHLPSWWESEAYERDGQAVIETLLSWDSERGHTPADTPDDWGLEVGVTLYNDDLSWTRPFCFGDGDADADFWATTWETGGVWGTNAPDSSAPYPDYNLWTDPCSQNGLEIGIGYPQKLKPDTSYQLFVQKDLGNLGESAMSGSASIKSNDCNNAGAEPSTNCMGLNTDRDPPDGVDGAAVYVNAGRGWTAPGCTLMIDGADEPIYMENGQFTCNSNS